MIRRLLPLIVSLLILMGGQGLATAMPEFGPESVPTAPDYSEAESWLSLPDNPDKHPVDIFWVYPTVLADDEHWLMDPASEQMRRISFGTIVKQASVFTGQVNLYAPMYRQMNMAALSLPAERQGEMMAYGKDDVWRAFTYYLEHHNNGRPFILAGHSQGSDILVEQAVRHWGTLGVEKQLVAAYLIGWSITEDDLRANPAMTMCTEAGQINCFISYNTVAEGRQKFAPTIRQGARVTNPLTWQVGGPAAPASMNIGAVFFGENGETRTIPHFTSARVEDSGLVVEPRDPALVDSGSATFPEGVYHVFDYSLFYENLKQNAGQRIRTMLEGR